MHLSELVTFVREQGIAVLATSGPEGEPQAALVGLAATDRGEFLFDTKVTTRKFSNIQRDSRVALVIGWDSDVTVQCQGIADVVTGSDRERCLRYFIEQYPAGAGRSADPGVALVRVRPEWIRVSDFRPGTTGVREHRLM